MASRPPTRQETLRQEWLEETLHPELVYTRSKRKDPLEELTPFGLDSEDVLKFQPPLRLNLEPQPVTFQSAFEDGLARQQSVEMSQQE